MANRIDAEREMNQAAQLLTRLYREELTRQGLVETGKLRDSIRWIVVTTTTGYSLKMEALDYFKFLDDRYGITNNVLKSAQYNRVNEHIANAYNYIILDELDSI